MNALIHVIVSDMVFLKQVFLKGQAVSKISSSVDYAGSQSFIAIFPLEFEIYCLQVKHYSRVEQGH